MSFSYRYSLVVELPASTPVEVLDWMRAAIEGAAEPPTFEVSGVARGMDEDAAQLLALAGQLERIGHGPDGWSHQLAVQIPNVHDDDHPLLYALPLFVAPYCEDGVLACMWTDMWKDMATTTFYVQDRVCFIGQGSGIPIAAVDGSDDAPDWRPE